MCTRAHACVVVGVFIRDVRGAACVNALALAVVMLMRIVILLIEFNTFH